MRETEYRLKDLMIGGLGGDADAHAALLRALLPVLRAFYRRRLGDDGEIEDLVQETLIAVHTRRASYDRDRPFTAWLYSIARYKMIDHLRRVGRHLPIDDVGDMLASEGFEESSNAHIDVGRLLGALPAKQAGAIRRTWIEGMSTAEAADAGGIGESDVKVSVHRGLKSLAARIRGQRR